MGEKKEQNGVEKRRLNGEGPCLNGKNHHKPFSYSRAPYFEDTEGELKEPFYTKYFAGFQLFVMTLLSYFADILRQKGVIDSGEQQELDSQRCFPPLGNHFEAVYTNNMYRIASDVVNRPLCGVPSSVMKLKDRVTKNYGWTYESVFLY